ncbi:MAG: hypothetical protein IRY97_08080 [Thermomicrobiaceae bacterium]|nr:hypothetical protein [Thermomicrobiaceae bacterium]
MLYRFLSGDYPISLALLAILGLWAARNRSTVRDLLAGSGAGAWVGRVTVGATLAAIAWIAALDNWRQLLAYVFSPRDRWMSDPFETTPTPLALRLVSLALVAVVVLGLAALYARARGHLLWPPALFLASTIYFYTFNKLRIRVDALLRLTDHGLDSVVAVGFTLFWASGLYLLIATVIIAAVVWLFSLAALPARLAYWLATRRREEREAEVFGVYRERAEALEREGQPPREANARPGAR